MNNQKLAVCLKRCKSFDRNWYLETYPDVLAAGFLPELHYAKYGCKMQRRPSLNFTFSELALEVEMLSGIKLKISSTESQGSNIDGPSIGPSEAADISETDGQEHTGNLSMLCFYDNPIENFKKILRCIEVRN